MAVPRCKGEEGDGASPAGVEERRRSSERRSGVESRSGGGVHGADVAGDVETYGDRRPVRVAADGGDCLRFGCRRGAARGRK
jgi:hypothetical protein